MFFILASDIENFILEKGPEPSLYVTRVARDGIGDFYHGLSTMRSLQKTLTPQYFSTLQFWFLTEKTDNSGTSGVIAEVLNGKYKHLEQNWKIGKFEYNSWDNSNALRLDDKIISLKEMQGYCIHQISLLLTDHRHAKTGYKYNSLYISHGEHCSRNCDESDYPNLVARDMGFSNLYDESIYHKSEGIFIEDKSDCNNDINSLIKTMSDPWKNQIFNTTDDLQIVKKLEESIFVVGNFSRDISSQNIEKIVSTVLRSEISKNKNLIMLIKNKNQENQLSEERKQIIITKQFIDNETWQALQKLATLHISAGDKSLEEAYSLGKYPLHFYHSAGNKHRYGMFPILDMEGSEFKQFSNPKGYSDEEVVGFSKIIGDRDQLIPTRLLSFWQEVVCPYVKKHYDFGMKLASYELQGQLLLKYYKTKDLEYLRKLKEITAKEEYENTRKSEYIVFNPTEHMLDLSCPDLPEWKAIN